MNRVGCPKLTATVLLKPPGAAHPWRLGLWSQQLSLGLLQLVGDWFSEMPPSARPQCDVWGCVQGQGPWGVAGVAGVWLQEGTAPHPALMMDEQPVPSPTLAACPGDKAAQGQGRGWGGAGQEGAVGRGWQVG